MSVLSRRNVLAGTAAVAGAALLERASLRGDFDHRTMPAPSAALGYASSLRALDAAGAGAGLGEDLRKGSLVHVGHSTHLLAVANARFLTDPWFFDPAFGALSHKAGPAVAPEHIGPLDAVVVSHDHPDHADLRAMDRLDKRALVLVATPDLAARVRRLGFRGVLVLLPWESIAVGDAVVHAVPAAHDVHEIGFVIEGAGHSVYFAGDTRLHPDLPAIAERLRPRVAILPVDGTRIAGEPLQVMTPDDAVTAARVLGAEVVMASHAEAILSDPLVKHALVSSIAGAAALFARRMATALSHVRCASPAPGETVVFTG